MMALKVRVREVAESKGITKTQLSYDTRISLNSIHKYWGGQQRMVKLEVLEKIAKALGVPAKDLLEETPEK